METTLNWLKKYCPVDLDAEAIDRALTMSGSEVEEREEVAATGDTALKLEITSNRTDCYGVIGLARELSAITGTPLTLPATDYPTGKEKTDAHTSVTLECEDLCPLYTAQLIKGVRVGPSPQWLLDLFETLGAVKSIRPVNNIVDITNYVMLEMAQPLHAFDYGKLAEGRIVVRRARRGERMRAINDIEYVFDEAPPADRREPGVNYDNWYWHDDICVIADAERPQCIGGVMGGLDTEIGEGTTDVLLEAAYFMPMNNRATSYGLGLYSDSSYRFSRGVDPAGVVAASRRAAQLIAEICGGEVYDGIIEAGRVDAPRHTVTFRHSAIERTMGIDVPSERVAQIFTGLGLEAADNGDGTQTVTAPSYRRDLHREIDLVEEIGRIHGFDQVPTDTIQRVRVAPPKPLERVTDRLLDVMVGAGYYQTHSDSFVHEEPMQAVTPWPFGGSVVVQNPVVKGQGLLRPTMIQSLLKLRKTNQDRGSISDVRLFETGRVYGQYPKKTKRKPFSPAMEKHVLAMTADGPDALFEVKGVVEEIGASLQIGLDFQSGEGELFEPGYCAAVYDSGGRRLGVLGMVAKPVLEALGLQTPCAVAELDVDLLVELGDFDRRYTDLPRYPGMHRELALVLPGDALWQDIEATIRKAGGELLTGVDYLEEYRGKQIPKGRKQYTLAMQFHHPDRSLTSGEINELTDSIVASLGKAHQAELRG